MSSNQKPEEKLKQLTDQLSQVAQEFQTNLTIAVKPYQDLGRSFSNAMTLAQMVIQEKDAEILRLKGVVAAFDRSEKVAAAT